MGPVAGLLELDGLTRRFGTVTALDQLSFSVPAGQVVGFLGPNGAGKTTTMRAVFGLTDLDAGTVSWNGARISQAERRRFGYMPEERGLYPGMGVADQLHYLARLHGLDASRAVAATSTWLERLGVADRATSKVESLSHGNQQRVQLAVALVHDPELLVLDEPFAGLDPEAVDSLSDVLRERAGAGTSILFSSHQLELVERVCRRVVILEAGRVLAAGTLRELRRRLPTQLRVKVDARWAPAIDGVEVVRADEDGVLLTVAPGVDPQAILAAAQAAGPVEHFGFESGGLIDLYRHMVRV